MRVSSPTIYLFLLLRLFLLVVSLLLNKVLEDVFHLGGSCLGLSIIGVESDNNIRAWDDPAKFLDGCLQHVSHVDGGADLAGDLADGLFFNRLALRVLDEARVFQSQGKTIGYGFSQIDLILRPTPLPGGRLDVEHADYLSAQFDGDNHGGFFRVPVRVEDEDAPAIHDLPDFVRVHRA